MFESDLGKELLKLPFIPMPHRLGHLTQLTPSPEADKSSRCQRAGLSCSDAAGGVSQSSAHVPQGESQALPRGDCRSMLS